HVSIAVWCNNASAGPTQLLHQIADAVVTFPPAAPVAQGAPRVDVSATDLARWSGLYRDRMTDQTIKFSPAGGELTSPSGRGGATTWSARSATTFQSAQGTATFSGSGASRSMMLVRADGDTARFDAVAAAATPIPLNDFVGTYASDELDVRLTITKAGD